MAFYDSNRAHDSSGSPDQQRRQTMARLRLLGPAREAAGTGSADIPGANVGEVLKAATARFGPHFAALLEVSRIWLNGDAADLDNAVGSDDEVAVLPPVSGG